jgi:predicted PurR-regulated permease PerM
MDDRTFKRRCLYVAVTVLALFIVLAMLWHISEIFSVCMAVLGKLFYYISPLIYAFIIAYILYIPLSRMEKWLCKNSRISKVKPQHLRIFTILVTYFAVIALIAVIIASVYLMIGGQLSKNIDINHMFEYIVNYLSGFKFGDISITDNPAIKETIASIENWIQGYLSSNISTLGDTVTSIGSTVVTVVISLIISIYFLMDYESLVERINDVYKGSFGRTVPGRKIYNIVSIFNRTFKQFLRGQLLEAVLVAVLSVIALWIAGVNYYGIIGVIAGICNLVPFVGPWIGAIVAAVVSLLGGGYMTAVWAVVAMVIVQQIDNHLLAPKIVGDSVGLHPVITMVVLIIGADVGGIVGMLLAVPVAATVKNILVYRKERREAEEGAVIIDGADTETKPAP